MYTANQLIEKRKQLWEQRQDIEHDKDFREAIANEMINSPKLMEEVRANPEKLIELQFVIVDKEKQLVPFFLNEVQKDFMDRLNQAKQDYKDGKISGISMLILKGRQQGFTTFVTAYQMSMAVLLKNFEGFTVADEADNAEAIFENKAKFPYSHFPEPLKPTEKYNNRRMLFFSKLNSSWSVEVATKQIGRSRTINFLHASEGAFWKYGIAVTQASLGQALTKDCIKIYESTANGYNDYKDMWDSGAHINCFYEWWRTSEYVSRFENEEKKQLFLSEMMSGKDWIHTRIRWLLDRGITPEQCHWYYVKWKESLDKELIKQEYPCTPEEAFLMSGRPVFNTEIIVNRIADLKSKYESSPYKQGCFSFMWNNPDSRDFILDSTIKFKDSDKQNWIRIYEEAQPGYPYVISGDTKGEGKDFFAATVINNVTGNRVASLHVQLDESKPFTWQLYCMGRYYNNALIGIEMNFNTGPIEELERLKYHRQYVRRKYDDITKAVIMKYGWKTDGNTRPLIIDKEVDIMKNNIDLINDIPTLEEALTFIYDDKGRPDAMQGKHDDLLLSEMIANEIRSQQSFTVETPENKKMKWTDDMREDFDNTSEEMRKIMIEKWGQPN